MQEIINIKPSSNTLKVLNQMYSDKERHREKIVRLIKSKLNK